NHACIAAGRTQTSPLVQSRMLLWCRGGEGTVRINRESHRFSAGIYVFLPWDSEIVYQAGADTDLRLGGIHVLPWCTAGDPRMFHVCHHPGSEYEELSRTRHDLPLPGIEGVLRGRF